MALSLKSHKALGRYTSKCQSFAHSQTLLEHWVLPVLAGWDCCVDLQRCDSTLGDLGPILVRQPGRFSVLPMKQQKLIPFVCIGSVNNKANIEYQQIIFFLLSASLPSILSYIPHSSSPNPRATQITENPSGFSRSRQPSAESPFKRTLKSRPVFTPSRLVCGRIVVTGRVVLLSSSATNGGNRRWCRSMFAAGWLSVYVVFPPVYFCVVVLQPGRQRGGLMARRSRRRRATPFNIFYKKSVSVLDQGKNLVWTEKFEKQEMRQTKVLSCLNVTRISSTFFFLLFYSAVWDFFSHSFYTSFSSFPVFPAAVSVRKSHTPVSSSLA